MEHDWGWQPVWAFTEAGPFGDVIAGWRGDKVCGGDPNLYVKAVRDWLKDVQQTPAYKQGRILGFTLFTSGGGSQWKLYETKQPEMDMLADMIAAEWRPGTVQPPPPPPPPPPPERDPAYPREGFTRKVTNVLPQDTPVEVAAEIFADLWESGKQTVGGSYDEAGLGPKELARVAQLWNIPQAKRQEFIDWYDLHYPGTQVIFKTTGTAEPDRPILDVVNALPKHATKRYKTRPLTDITTLTIHHTVSPCNRSTASIAQYHVDSRDWPGIGYHYVIGCDGKIEHTNYDETISYHAGVAGHDNNEVSIGIALKDDFTDHPPTQQALDSARWLVQHLKAQYNGLVVKRHRDMPGASTACPGATSPQWIDYVAGK